jgi:hypothetical protein
MVGRSFFGAQDVKIKNKSVGGAFYSKIMVDI